MITKEAIDIFPNNIKKEILEMCNIQEIQEVRIKVTKPLICISNNREHVSKYIPTLEDIKLIVQKISNYSIYAFEDEMKQGYITIQGGHRVGICGSCVVEKGSIKTIKNISSINFRIAREVKGCSDNILPYIISGDNVLNTIIISPPKCGKTTILRDLTRQISNGIKPLSFNGKNVVVIDERSEIASCFKGIPQMDIGIRTDVLDSGPKSEGIIMAIRSMAPNIIICDEIGTAADMNSIILALNSGVNLITTIHGYNEEDLYKRPVFKELLENRVFQKGVILSNRKGIGTIEYIYDFTKGEILRRD